MNYLYPIKFRPIIKDKIWGGTRLKTSLNKNAKTDKAGESWEISGYPGSISRASNGFLAGNTLEELIEVYMADLMGEAVFDQFGTFFPLLIKFIDANDILSVQVHPDDELAGKIFGSHGKSELWYIVDAKEDAEVVIGFREHVTREQCLRHVMDKTLMDILNIEKVRSGDVFFLPPGRVHAIGSGVLLAEIQQTSDATLRLYDFDRLDEKGKPRELHLDHALEAIDYNVYQKYKTEYRKVPNTSNLLAKCNYFTVNYMEVNKVIEKDYYELDSFVVYMCLGGSLDIFYNHRDKEPLQMGETILLPAELKNIRLVPREPASLLEIYIEGESPVKKTGDILERLF